LSKSLDDHAARVLDGDQSGDAGQVYVPALSTDIPQLPEVINRYRSGESVQTIAKDNQVNARTIYRWMLAGLGDKEYYNLVTEALVDRIADADMQLANARNMVEAAVAKSACRFSRMDLERRRPFLYGAKIEGPDSKVVVYVNRGRDKNTLEVAPHRARESQSDDVIVEPISADTTPGA
jgi:hypothetical protein